jgi:all-trans-retinol 13,14-reductase
LKNYISYKQNPNIEKQYDAICIGSGLGSLTTASLLARAGKRVLVLEKHYTPGGFTHTFTRNDYEWDVGLHYVGEVNKEGTLLKILFDDITDGNLLWEDMGEVYDRIIIDGKEYEFVKGVNNFKERMKLYFPSEKDAIAIDKYVSLLFEASAAGKNYYLEKALPKFVAKIAGSFLRRKLSTFYKRTTLEVLESLTDNKTLIAVLSAQFGDYGMPPAQSSFDIHAVVAKHYLNGGAYPIGGSGEIFETIAPSILKNGGDIYINAGVTEILIENGDKAVGVKLKDGKEIKAPLIISGAGAEITYNHLVSKKDQQQIPFLNDLNKLNASASHISLYIGLEETAEQLGLQKANYWIYPCGIDHDKAVAEFEKDVNNEFPVVYISFPSAKDPKFLDKYPGRATIEIITISPYKWFEKWEGTRWKKRGEEYDAFKEQLSQRLLAHLYKVEPQLKGKISFYELSSPLTTKNFCSYTTGEIYGLDHTPERFDQKFLRPKSPFKNLYLTGQDIVSVGIGGALISGVITASAILNKNILGEIVKKKKNSI